MTKEIDLENLLKQYSSQDFANLIPDTILKISKEERLTVEFAFWFCHSVEQDLNATLTQAANVVNEMLGKSSEDLDNFIRTNIGLKMEKVDPAHPAYRPNEISFGDRIFFVEKVRGKTAHTRFLWKIKNIRDNLSHGRIKELSYNSESLFDLETKSKMVKDYITLSKNIDSEESSGIVGELTHEQHQRTEQLFEDWKNKHGIE